MATAVFLGRAIVRSNPNFVATGALERAGVGVVRDGVLALGATRQIGVTAVIRSRRGPGRIIRRSARAAVTGC